MLRYLSEYWESIFSPDTVALRDIGRASPGLQMFSCALNLFVLFLKVGMIGSYPQCSFSTGGRQRTPNDSDSDEELRAAIRASLQETHMNRSPTLEDYDPGIQSAIRESLDSAGVEPSRWSNDQRPRRGGPSSVPPPYPLRDEGPLNPRSTPPGGATSQSPPYPRTGGLYPRLHDPPSYTDATFSRSPPYPSQREGLYSTAPEPSAPPAEHVVNGYPGSSLPYPTQSRIPEPSSLEEIRRRRIQRFET